MINNSFYYQVPGYVLDGKMPAGMIRLTALVISRLNGAGIGSVTMEEALSELRNLENVVRGFKYLKRKREVEFSINAKTIEFWRYGWKPKEAAPSVGDDVKQIVAADEEKQEDPSVKLEKGAIKDVIINFVQYCEQLKGFQPMVSWPRDSAIVKKRLQYFNKEQLKEVIDLYLRRDHGTFAITLAAAMSDFSINAWQAKRANA